MDLSHSITYKNLTIIYNNSEADFSSLLHTDLNMYKYVTLLCSGICCYEDQELSDTSFSHVGKSNLQSQRKNQTCVEKQIPQRTHRRISGCTFDFLGPVGRDTQLSQHPFLWLCEMFQWVSLLPELCNGMGLMIHILFHIIVYSLQMFFLHHLI